MTGYVRADTSNNIADGNIINAADFDAEYNAIEAAFVKTTGHKHDGTDAEGAPITKVGPAQDVVVSSSTVLPKTTATMDLGSGALKFKDAHFSGTINGTLAGNATNVSGVVAFANGGTGQTTQQAAINALTNDVTSGQYLRGNGTNVVMAALQAADITGVVAVANGGTGLSSPGTSGNVLTSNGTAWTSSAIPPGGLTYVTKTSNYTASDKEGVLANTSGGAFTVTLPATPTTGYQVVVADAGNAWGTNNLTVGRNGSTIGSLAEDLVCDITGASVQLVYDGTTWEVYTQVGGQGGSVVTLTGTQTLTNKTMDYNNNTFTNFPPSTPFSNSTSLAQVQAISLSF